MTMIRLIAITLLLVPFLNASTPPTQVMVLVTMHQLHGQLPGYGFDELGRTVEKLHPDVLCVEVGAKDLEVRPAEKNKQEYPKVIYPLIDRGHYRVYPLEPPEPTYSAIVGPYVRAKREFAASEPAKAKVLDSYIDGVYAVLTAYWTSPTSANDGVTDEIFRAKHALQEAMVGPGERLGWEAWNQHFLSVVIKAARENPGKRILVTVGADHGYWLRGHLVGVEGIELLDPIAQLDSTKALLKPVQ